MTLAQDKRSSRLLARWRACDRDLNVKVGVMGLVRKLPNPFVGKIGADSTKAATIAMLARAVAPLPPPYVADPRRISLNP